MRLTVNHFQPTCWLGNQFSLQMSEAEISLYQSHKFHNLTGFLAVHTWYFISSTVLTCSSCLVSVEAQILGIKTINLEITDQIWFHGYSSSGSEQNDVNINRNHHPQRAAFKVTLKIWVSILNHRIIQAAVNFITANHIVKCLWLYTLLTMSGHALDASADSVMRNRLPDLDQGSWIVVVDAQCLCQSPCL